MSTRSLLFCLSTLLLFSCNKTDTASVPTSLEGTWKMVLVKDHATGALLIRPSSLQGEVLITFAASSPASGTLTGHTPSNTIAASAYTLGTSGSLSIPNLSMTKVGETPWGSLFVDNIRQARHYQLHSPATLTIITTSKSLTFKKQ